MHDIVIIDSNEVRPPKVLLYVFIELCQAFKERGYTVKIIHSIHEITNNSIVFLGDAYIHPNIVSILNAVAPDAIYIGWYWHRIDVSGLKHFIHTYENMLNPDSRVLLLKGKLNSCPLLLRASDNPDLIGFYEKNIQYDYCYMGWDYRPDLVPSDPYKGFYLGTTDTSLFLSYDARKEIYLSSMFALGIQNNGNIYNKHVSQRIFEGLAYGCIVLSNSLSACEQTDNIVVYVTSKQDVEDKIKFYKEHHELFLHKQEEGYAFIKKCGTNHYAIDMFIQCILANFDIII